MNGEGLKKQQALPHFPQDFKDILEALVLEILRDRPNDPLEFAFHFFSKKLKCREESKDNGTKDEDTVEQKDKEQHSLGNASQTYQANAPSLMSENQAATIIQAYFRGYSVRRNWWRKRFLVTKLNYHDHLGARRFLDSPRGSFSFHSSEDNICFNYDSDQSLDA